MYERLNGSAVNKCVRFEETAVHNFGSYTKRYGKDTDTPGK